MSKPEPPVSKVMAFCMLIGMVGTLAFVITGVVRVVVWVLY